MTNEEIQKEEIQKDIQGIAALAQTVGAQREEMDKAFDAEKAAEAALLRVAVTAAKPALHALGSRLKARDASTSGRNGCNPVQENSYHPKRGCVLISTVRRDKDSTGNSGTYVGDRLVLLTDGQFAVQNASGSWSYWQGSWDTLELSLEPLTDLDTVQEFKVAEILKALQDKLRKQADGKAPDRAKAARARAEKLSAIVKLVP